MAERIQIPAYPQATLLFHHSMAARGGGGGSTQNTVTADPPEVVIAFYEERLGVAERNAPAESATWRIADAQPGWNGGQHLEVWPSAGPYPFRNSLGSLPQPSDAHTVIHLSYMYVPLRQESEAETFAEPTPVAQGGRRPTLSVVVILMTLTAIGGLLAALLRVSQFRGRVESVFRGWPGGFCHPGVVPDIPKPPA